MLGALQLGNHEEMVLEPGQCPPADLGCIVGVATSFGIMMGAAFALVAIPTYVLLALLTAARVVERTGRLVLGVVAACRVVIAHVTLACAFMFLLSVFDQVGGSAKSSSEWLDWLVPMPAERGASSWQRVVDPVATLHFWLVALDAWRWQRRTIAEHEARQRAESATRAAS